MIKYIYSIYNKRVGFYGNLQQADLEPSKAAAFYIRDFKLMKDDEKTKMAEDYDAVYLGTYNDISGIIEAHTPETIVNYKKLYDRERKEITDKKCQEEEADIQLAKDSQDVSLKKAQDA